MNPQLQEALDALEKADAAGNVEDAKALADYIRQLQAQEESSSADMTYPVSGAAIGAATGAVTGPAVGAAVDTAATKVAEKVAGPKGTPRGDKVAKWLATQTTGPNVGGATFEEAYKKSEIARGKPVQSRGSQVPIRKGFLGIENQPAEPSLPQKTAANIISSERLGKPSIPRRVGGMGVMGAEAGKTISDVQEGNYGDAAISALGTIGGALSQSRIKPLRAIGTGLSLLVPTVQGGKEVKDIFYPPKQEEEKAAGGLIHLADGRSVNEEKPFVGYPQIKRSKKATEAEPQVDKYTGMLDALIGGAKRENLSVFDPKQMQYSEAYDKYEPLGIALMGAPFLGGPIRSMGKALAPKAGQAAEDLLARQGLISYAVPGGKAIKNEFIPTPTKVVKASEALGPNEGKYLLPTQSDRMRSTMGDLGGSGFSKFQLEKPEYAEAKAAWGVGKKPTATGIINVNKKYGDQAIWTPMLGSKTQHHSNQHVFDMLAEEFNRQAKMGNLPKELQEKINFTLANAKDTKGLFPEYFDIGNPEHLIKYGDTFDRRSALSTIMSGQGVGGTKGRIIDYPGIMQEMTDPMTIGAPTHSLGTRLFTLNNEVEYRPDLHSAFPYILKGTDQGVAFAPVPKELGIPDFINQFKEFKGREPGYYDLVRTIPSQQITDKYLRSLEAAGYKEGGSTTPAWQRKEGKSPSGGLNALGRASYKRETGGELKAPQPEGGSRKKSFCARMGGMKKKLTSAKTANDPDSRINKALRKWKC